jgi:hypothetical protein
MSAFSPTPTPEGDALRARLKVCADKLGSINALSKASGIPHSTLRKYFFGGEPSMRNIVTIARTAEVSIEWLAAGVRPFGFGDGSLRKDPLCEQKFQMRFDQLLTRFNGVGGLSALTQIPEDRLSQVKAGAELNRTELRVICQATQVSVTWLLCGNDNQDIPLATDDIVSEIMRVVSPEGVREAVEDFQRIARKCSAAKEFPFDRLSVIGSLMSRLPALPLVAHTMHDDSMDPTFRKGDLLVFAGVARIVEPGIYLLADIVLQTLMVVRIAVNAGEIKCGRDNKSYDSFGGFSFDSNLMQCHGRLVARITD